MPDKTHLHFFDKQVNYLDVFKMKNKKTFVKLNFQWVQILSPPYLDIKNDRQYPSRSLFAPETTWILPEIFG